MKVKTNDDWDRLPKGTVIQVVKTYKDTYYGLWTSMYGSHHIHIPKEICEISKEPS